MVVVSRFRWFGWFVLCVGVVLGCYLMSSRVAAERNKLSQVERDIARTEREIKALDTEFDTRSNLAQLQRWNGDTLKLSAPTAAQYVRDDAQLAALADGTQADGGVQTAVAVVPSAPVAPDVIDAVPVSTAPTPLPAKPIAKPVLAAAIDKPARPQPALAKAAPAKPRAQIAMLDRRIIGGSSLGDLMRRVRADDGAR